MSSIRLVLLTHDDIGSELLKTVSTMVDTSLLTITVLSIPSDIKAAQKPEFSTLIESTLAENKLANNLVLCDIYGATPYNLIQPHIAKNNIAVITGLNLGMLLKAVQMTESSLEDASKEIFLSAQKNIILE